MDSDQNNATTATIIKDSFTHRIRSIHVDGMEYHINVHLPLSYGMNEVTYPVMAFRRGQADDEQYRHGHEIWKQHISSIRLATSQRMGSRIEEIG